MPRQWTLSDFIRGFQIRADCVPLRNPFLQETRGYSHRCTLYIGGKEHRRLVVPYTTPNPASVHVEGTTLKSRVSAHELLYTLACEVGLYEISKRQIEDEDGERIGVAYDQDTWESLVFSEDDMPPPDEVRRRYLNTQRMAHDLRVFLEGRRAAEQYPPTIYLTLLSEVAEVAHYIGTVVASR